MVRTGRMTVAATLVWLAGSNVATAQDCPATLGQQVMELINEVRADSGLAPLSVDTRLVAAAERHANDMAAKQFLDHTGSDGSSMTDRVDHAGYRWRTISENVAAGHGTADAVFHAWMNSELHRVNILSRSVQHLGIGYAQTSADEYRHYWTIDLGASLDEIRAPPGGCHP